MQTPRTPPSSPDIRRGSDVEGGRGERGGWDCGLWSKVFLDIGGREGGMMIIFYLFLQKQQIAYRYIPVWVHLHRACGQEGVCVAESCCSAQQGRTCRANTVASEKISLKNVTSSSKSMQGTRQSEPGAGQGPGSERRAEPKTVGVCQGRESQAQPRAVEVQRTHRRLEEQDTV